MGKDKSSDRDDLVSLIGPSFKNINLIKALKGFSTSSGCSVCKCQDCKAKHDGVINVINALTASIKEITSKRAVIPSKKILYPYTPLEIKVAKRRRKEISKASSSIEKSKITTPLSLSCTFDQCTRATGEQHELKKIICCISVISINSSVFPGGCQLEATTDQHNITVDNPSTAFMEEEKVEHVSWKNERITHLKGSTSRTMLQKTNKINQRLFRMDCRWTIKALRRIPAGLPWHLVDEVYILINCGDEFHWVLAIVILKERHIRVYDLMSRRRRPRPSSEIQKLAKILPTYLDLSGFLNQKVRTDWSMIEAYRDKMGNSFDVEYVEGITQ
ncbi:hypothetical protein BC332_15339 [Capsicum chinense]|nr:hypothetical protein BC332_15339 [Capsicum chinense]